MRLLLVTPPMTQINGPYPATAALSGFLRSEGHQVFQVDLGLELFLALFSKAGLQELADLLREQPLSDSPVVQFFCEAQDDYVNCVESVVKFLQGRDPTLALRLAQRTLVPEGPRFAPLHEHEKQIRKLFGGMGVQDFAKYIGSLFLDDLADVWREGVDPEFGFSRYGESLASSKASFTPLWNKLHAPHNLIDRNLQQIWQAHLTTIQPDVVALTVPFPGNLYGGLRLAQQTRKISPQVKVVMGGGYVNTELRDLSDRRIFDFVHALTYDDGELPLRQLLQFWQGHATQGDLVRTRLDTGKKGQIPLLNSVQPEIAFKDRPRPSFLGLRLSDYVSMLEMPNPVHRLWSDFRWNKMILAHGCYWKKCTFCDVSLDYIGRYDPAKAEALVDQMEELIQETGHSGFHFVDEAAPPALLRTLSKEILRRGLKVTWWGNLRFDKNFDAELVELMSDAGCVAVTGGLEVASPRLLQLINKGVTVEQVAQVTRNFSTAKIFVHAYLMYGFPTQNVQETVDSLETVRQLFQAGCVHSAHWHRFLATIHSPVGLAPEKFKIELRPEAAPAEGLFARYAVDFFDPLQVDHDQLGIGLRKALYNYMHGLGLEEDVRNWFPVEVPRTTLSSKWLAKSLAGSGLQRQQLPRRLK